MQAELGRTWGSGEEALRPDTAERTGALEASAQPCAQMVLVLALPQRGPEGHPKVWGQEPLPP